MAVATMLAAMVLVLPVAAMSVRSVVSPSGPTRRNVSGDTGSLKVGFSAAGGRATTARSAGSS